MGLIDRRRSLMHHGAAARGTVSNRKVTNIKEPEELDNLSFVSMPSIEDSKPNSRCSRPFLPCDDESASVNDVLRVGEEAVDALIRECAEAYDRERFDDLLRFCEESVVQGVVVPFGLGGVLPDMTRKVAM